MCPVCKEEKSSVLFERKDVKLVICNACHLVYADNSNNRFDASEYDYYRNRIDVPKEELYDAITEKRYAELLRKAENYRKNNEILDIGCGEGHFLSVAGRMKWKVTGIEQATYAVEICKKLGLNVLQSDLLKLDLREGYYDVVTMFEVVEHLAHPKEYLLEANKLLRKGGICVLTTPNFDCLTRLLLRERSSLISKQHLIYFSPKTIKDLLKKCNFKILELKVNNITLPELRKLFNKNVRDKGYAYNQKIRKTVEANRSLFILKSVINYFLNLSRLGETIYCICQKV